MMFLLTPTLSGVTIPMYTFLSMCLECFATIRVKGPNISPKWLRLATLGGEGVSGDSVIFTWGVGVSPPKREFSPPPQKKMGQKVVEMV